MKTKRLTLLALLWLLLLAAACPIGDRLRETDLGLPCNTDDDCATDFECVRAESANAESVCMPILDSAGSG